MTRREVREAVLFHLQERDGARCHICSAIIARVDDAALVRVSEQNLLAHYRLVHRRCISLQGAYRGGRPRTEPDERVSQSAPRQSGHS